jgi:hypothetical protein
MEAENKKVSDKSIQKSWGYKNMNLTSYELKGTEEIGLGQTLTAWIRKERRKYQGILSSSISKLTIHSGELYSQPSQLIVTFWTPID